MKEVLKKIKNETFATTDQVFLMLRGVGLAILGIFLYKFIFSDYSYWKSNEQFFMQLAVLSMTFILLDRIVDLIKAVKSYRKKSYSKLKLVVSILMLLVNFILFFMPFMNIYSPKVGANLPNMEVPKSITIHKHENKNCYLVPKGY